MSQLDCLILAQGGAHYALTTDAVREVVWRPWLTPFAEMPTYVAGIFQLRGRMVPVIDLQSRLGGTAPAPQPTQSIVVLEHGGHWLGLLVEAVSSVVTLPTASLEPVTAFALPGTTARFLKAGARLPEGLVWFLDVQALIDHSECSTDSANLEIAQTHPPEQSVDAVIYQQRAERLAQVPETGTSTAQQIAVLGLGGEAFGLPLTCVRSFVHLRGLTPVPGAPPHIAGHMNSRGELLLVVDMRYLIGLPVHAPALEVAVVQFGDLELGLLIESIDDIAPHQTQESANSGQARSALCHGVIQHGAQCISLIDTQALRARLLDATPPTPSTPLKPTESGDHHVHI